MVIGLLKAEIIRPLNSIILNFFLDTSKISNREVSKDLIGHNLTNTQYFLTNTSVKHIKQYLGFILLKIVFFYGRLPVQVKLY